MLISDYCVRNPFVSNLTVSYVSQTPAAPSAGPAAAPATDSPLGFLAALLDQVLARGAQTGGNGTEASASAAFAGLLDVDTGDSGDAASDPAQLAANLIAALDAQLAGQSDPGHLADLRDTIDALAALLDAAPTTGASAAPGQIDQLLTDLGLIEPVTSKVQPAAAPAPDLATLRDKLATLAQSVAATAPDLAQQAQTLAAKLDSVVADPAPALDPDALTIAGIIRTLLGHGAKPDADPAATESIPQTDDDLLRVLATFGLSPAAAPATAGAEATATTTTANTTVPAPLLRLSNQLTQVASELAATAPELAQKLEAVATRLVSGDADPNLLGKLTSAAASPDGAALDKLVQSLIDARPAAPAPVVAPAPQIAAPKDLALPAPLAPQPSGPAVAEATPGAPAPVAAATETPPEPTARVTLTARHDDPAAEPKVAAKVATVVADAARTDPATQPAAPPQQAAPLAAQQARALPAAYQPVANPINMGQLAFEMVRQVHHGMSRFTIRLDPPELGRVDVRMHVDAQGALNARLTVERAETLDLFQRDQRSLERALAQAGLDAGKTNLEFSLRQQSHNPFTGMMGGDQHQQHPGYGNAPRFSLAGTDDTTSLPAVTLYRGTASAGGVNIFA